MARCLCSELTKIKKRRYHTMKNLLTGTSDVQPDLVRVGLRTVCSPCNLTALFIDRGCIFVFRDGLSVWLSQVRWPQEVYIHTRHTLVCSVCQELNVLYIYSVFISTGRLFATIISNSQSNNSSQKKLYRKTVDTSINAKVRNLISETFQ